MIQEGSLRGKALSIWHVQRVKRLIRDRVGSQCLVSVRDTICKDPGCEGPATDIRIVLLDFREIKLTIHKAAADVTRDDVSFAL